MLSIVHKSPSRIPCQPWDVTMLQYRYGHVGLVITLLTNADLRAALPLVDNGVPKATIVVMKSALTADPEPKADATFMPQPEPSKVAAAARDLQRYIAKMTGGSLPIVSDEKEPTGPVILVGRSALTKGLDTKIPTGLTPIRDEEGFVILVQGDRLLLAGNDAGPYHGTEYAVAEFLHRQGVRWFLPGDYGEFVPKHGSVMAGDGEICQKPDFRMRNWWGGRTAEMAAAEYRWKIRNKMNPVLHFVTLPQDNSWAGTIPAELLKTQPELFGLRVDGTRDAAMPNLTNPKTVELTAQTYRERFRKTPTLHSIGVAPDDGIPRDNSAEALKRNLGFPDQVGRMGVPAEQSVTEEWMTFVNNVAREVKKEFPDRVIVTNGYANRNTPPIGMSVENNVWVMFAAIWSDTLHAYDDPRSWQTVRQGKMIKRWAELCPVFMYDYSYVMLASGGSPVPLARKYRRDMPLLKKWGVVGFSDEGRFVTLEAGIAPTYLRARLMWNAGLDVDALLDDYFTTWYGSAAKPARAFWDALEKVMEETPMLGHEDRILPYVYTPALMKELAGHLAEAERQADTDVVKKHVRADRLTLEHLKGYLALHEAEWACDFAGAVKQANYMFEQRKQLADLSLFYCQADDIKSISGFYYWGLAARRAYYQTLADRTTGKAGELVAVLPERTAFKIDPRDDGRFNDWFAADFPDNDWKTIRTTEPFYNQGYRDQEGYPYMGAVWYRFTVDVPASAKGKNVFLYAPAVETEAWGWVNGQFVGHKPHRDAYERPNEINFDVTAALEPGRKNFIALRVHTHFNAAQQSAAMTSRAFLYAPKP
jgi:hypothetical protein